MMDIVFPKNNEKELILNAEALGYKEIFLVYPISSFRKIDLKTRLSVKYGVFCEEKNIEKAKRLSLPLFVKNPAKIQHLFESNKNLYAFDIEQNNKQDSVISRKSGLNHVLCKLANKNNIKICFSFKSLLEIDIKQRSVMIGRLKKNISLCKKYKVDYILASFASNLSEMRGSSDINSFLNQIK
jgi:RNase P/RNase MRP subunit p30